MSPPKRPSRLGPRSGSLDAGFLYARIGTISDAGELLGGACVRRPAKFHRRLLQVPPQLFRIFRMVRAREVALESIQLSSGVDASGLARIAANATNPPRGHVD
jgi:hypothetical protein